MNRRSFFRAAAVAPLAAVPGFAEAKSDALPSTFTLVEHYRCDARFHCGSNVYYLGEKGPTCFWCRNPWKGPIAK